MSDLLQGSDSHLCDDHLFQGDEKGVLEAALVDHFAQEVGFKLAHGATPAQHFQCHNLRRPSCQVNGLQHNTEAAMSDNLYLRACTKRKYSVLKFFCRFFLKY